MANTLRAGSGSLESASVRIPASLRPVVAVIPARGGSKRIPRKALALLAGRPLVVHAIAQALRLKRRGILDRVVVSTEDREIAAVSRRAGAEVIARPRPLATDRASTLSVIRHLRLEGTVVLLQATSPLRADADIEACLSAFARGRAPSVVTVADAHPKPEWMYRPRGRRLGKAVVRGTGSAVALNGAVYVASARHLRTKGFVVPGTRFILMPRERSVDIDEPADLAMAEALMRRRA